MVKAKDKTLRRKKTPSKRTYLRKQKGGEDILEFRNLYDTFESNLEIKNKLYNEIQKEASFIYDSETSDKNNSYLNSTNEIISFLEEFYQKAQKDVNNKRESLEQD